MKVINLFGGPGCGKSTTAAALFVKMKNQGMKVELVTEFAKDLTWEKRKSTLTNQLYILAKQDQRLRRLEGQVDWAITDSPLPLSLAYRSGPFVMPWFENTVRGVWRSYDNLSVQLVRAKPYAEFGRNQTEQEARALDNVVEDVLLKVIEPGTYVWMCLGNEAASSFILDNVVLPNASSA